MANPATIVPVSIFTRLFAKENLIIWLLSLTFVATTVVAIYLLFLPRKTYPTEFFQFDEATQQFKKLNGDPLLPAITDVDSTGAIENPSLAKVLKGYFHNYDAKNRQLQLKNEFLDSSYLQLLTVSLNEINQFYCWPETVSGERGEVATKTLQFYIYPNNQDLAMPGEKYYSLDLLTDFLKPNHYLIIQLKEQFYLNSDNHVQKLILVGC